MSFASPGERRCFRPKPRKFEAWHEHKTSSNNYAISSKWSSTVSQGPPTFPPAARYLWITLSKAVDNLPYMWIT
jgi:hypothetical protein